MINIAAVTSGYRDPSSRFRVRQTIPGLAEQGIRVLEYAPAIDKCQRIPGWPERWSPKYILPLYGLWQGTKLLTRLPALVASQFSDLTWLGRELLPGYLTLEPWLKKPLVFDVDDAIWQAKPWGEKAIGTIARQSELVIAGSAFLAEWFSGYARRVEIVPTAVDCSRFRPLPAKRTGLFTIGWIGSASNLPYLQAIEAPLREFLSRHRDARLLVMADRPPQFSTLASHCWDFRPWHEADEVNAISDMDVGLMPLADTEWTRGKCSYKMLQYLACGKPVVVSPVGMNAEILNAAEVGYGATEDGDWIDALETIFDKSGRAAEMGRNGRLLVEQRFSLDVVNAQLAALFRQLI